MDLTTSQNLVINTKNKELLVSASAGSGKTFVVIERIIDSIKKGQDVSKLLVLTFTNVAASELKERLVNKLNDLKEEYLKLEDKMGAIRIAKQIAKVPMADVSTIHSFCLSIIKNNFYILGLDPNVTTLDATKATIMLMDIIQDVIEEEFENSNQEFMDILDIHNKEENLIDTIHMLYNAYKNAAFKDKWLENACNMYELNPEEDLANTEFGQVILHSIKDKFLILKAQLVYTIDLLEGLQDFETRKEVLLIQKKYLEQMLNLNTIDDMYTYITNYSNLRLPSTKITDEALNEQIKATKSSVEKQIKDTSKMLYNDSCNIIKELNEASKYINWYKQILLKVDMKYTELKKEKGVIDFSDYEHLALKALEDENVRKKYEEKYDEIYVDEYQDTSDLQEAIINRISKNNVIMVGDVKQSIYGFRNAKPDLFTDKYIKLKEVTDQKFNENKGKIILSKNFRSRKEVLDSVNDIFSLLMSSNFGGVDYNETEKLSFADGHPECEDNTYKTEINIIEKDVKDLEENDELEAVADICVEANKVAQKIQELVNSNFKLYDTKKEKYRKCEYKDIVILLRSVEGKANIVSDVLSQYNIPSYADSKSGFYKSDEISLIIAFLKILNNPLDDIAQASVMYSVIGKFTLDELAQISLLDTSKGIYNTLKESYEKLDKSLQEKVLKYLSIIERYNKYLKVYTIADIILKLYEETGVYYAMRMDNMGEMKCTNLDNFVQIVSDFEKSENVSSLENLLSYLRVLKDKESAGDSPKLIGENDNVVRIMTIHKSKGLEFPVVILMNTANKYNEQDTKDKLQFDDKLGIGIDIFNKESNITYPSVIKQAIKEKSKKSLRAEALRLLYVALTRAKEKLIIYGTVPNIKKLERELNIVDKQMADATAQSNNSHLKCILQGAFNSPDNFNINTYARDDIQIVQKDEISVKRNEDKFLQFNNEIKKLQIVADKKKIEDLKSRLLIQRTISDVNKKYTVTELKKGDTLDIKELKPNTLQTSITATSYGTLLHNIIEHLDYTKISKEHIKTVVKEQININELNGKVSSSKVIIAIEEMYNNLRHILDGAKEIKNEMEFVVLDDLELVLENKFEKPTLIQGVVDMYVLTKEGNSYIIDFKTDKVNEQSELKDKYSLQLNVYKRAIESALNVEIKGLYIYSFALKKLIEV